MSLIDYEFMEYYQQNLDTAIKAYVGNKTDKKLSELKDVKITDVSNGQGLRWDSSLNKWVNGSVSSDIQVNTIPQASQDLLNAIVQYVGVTTQDYTNGYFYKCVYKDGNYVWQNQPVQKGNGKAEDTEFDDTNSQIGKQNVQEALDYVIEKKQDADDKMKPIDMDDVVTPLPVSLAERYKYTTTERVIGAWLNQKPLYQKTIQIPSLPNNTSVNIAHGIANVDMIFIGEGSFCLSPIGNYSPLPCMYVASNNNVSLVVNSTQIIAITGSDMTDWSAVVTLQYTKTTDTASN